MLRGGSLIEPCAIVPGTEKISNRCNMEYIMLGNHDVMQDRECIVFEQARDTDQRIHEPCACLWVPCSSRYCRPLRKIITQRNVLCLWSKIIRKASLAHHNVFSFKKRPNISLYVENSRNLIWFFEDFKFAYKTTKFYAKWLVRNFRQKHELICCVKSGFQILYAVQQFSSHMHLRMSW